MRSHIALRLNTFVTKGSMMNNSENNNDETMSDKLEVPETQEIPQTEESNQEQTQEKAQVEQSPEEKQEAEYKTKYLYLVAELDNMQKRFAREKESLIKYGNERILSDLIDVIDNLEISHDEDPKVKNIVVGVDMIRAQFLDLLNRYGLTPVQSVGSIFDPNLHDAVSKRSDETKKEDEVLEEYQKGYILNGRLVRASKVVVCSK
jgi:molecular chaperone GrpE